MKKFMSMLLAVCLTLCLAACGGADAEETDAPDEPTASPETTQQADPQEKSTPEAQEESGLIQFAVREDANGNPILRVQFTMTNQSGYDLTYMTDCHETVTQGSEQLEMVSSKDLPDGVWNETGEDLSATPMTVVADGESLDVYLFYALKDTQTPITVEIDGSFLYDDLEDHIFTATYNFQ